MRIAVCGNVAVVCLSLTIPALAQAPGAPPPPVGRPMAEQGSPPPGYSSGNEERTALNSLYVEGLGPGFFYAFNYERIVSDIAIRAGIGYLSISASSGTGDSASAYWLSIPLDINYIGIGSKKHIFELGAGATIVSVGAGASSLGVESSGSATLVYGHMNIGYRLQPPTGGFMLRTGISPIIGSGVFLPWPYIALGATF